MNLFKLTTGFLLIALALLLNSNASAQINTEKYRKYYDDKTGFIFNLSTAISLKAGNTEYTAYKGAARLDYNGKKFDSFLVGNFEYKKTAEAKVENQGFLHLRGIMHLTKRTNWETFVQRQYDEFIDLNVRNLVGTGVKYRLIDFMAKDDSTKTLDINVSTGVMYETENYTLDESTVDRYDWRWTNFISFDWLIKKKLNFTGVIYYQPAFADFNNYRITAETGLEFRIAKSVNFIVEFNYRYNNMPVTKVEKFDLSLINGIRIEIK